MPRSTRSPSLFFEEPDSDSDDRKPSAEIRYQSVDQSPVCYNLVSPEFEYRVVERTRESVVAEPHSETNRMESTISGRGGTDGSGRQADFNASFFSMLQTCFEQHPEILTTLRNLVQEPSNDRLRQENEMLKQELAGMIAVRERDNSRALDRNTDEARLINDERDCIDAAKRRLRVFYREQWRSGPADALSTVVRGRDSSSAELTPAKRQRLDEGNAPY